MLSKRADGSEERVRLVYDHDLLDSYTEMPPLHAMHHHHPERAMAVSCHYREHPPAGQDAAAAIPWGSEATDGHGIGLAGASMLRAAATNAVTHAASKVESAAATCADI